MNIGIDIVSIERFKNLIRYESYLKNIFTERENNLFKNSNNLALYAALFASKEASLKALGYGLNSEIKLNEIETVLFDNKYVLNFYGEAKIIENKKKISQKHVSISWCKDYSIASVILE